MTAGAGLIAAGRTPASDRTRRASILSAYRAERRKLTAQLPSRILALVCVLGPFVFAGVLKLQSGVPADTLFGAWVHSSGFAVSLVVLSFAGSWGFPMLAGVLAGDCSPPRIVTGPGRRSSPVAAPGAICSLARSWLQPGSPRPAWVGHAREPARRLVLTGAHPLVGLSGTVLASGHSSSSIAVSWLLSLLPCSGSRAWRRCSRSHSRNGIIGVIGTALVALAMQFLALVGTGSGSTRCCWGRLRRVARAVRRPSLLRPGDRGVPGERGLDRRLRLVRVGDPSAGAATSPAHRSRVGRAGCLPSRRGRLGGAHRCAGRGQ